MRHQGCLEPACCEDKEGCIDEAAVEMRCQEVFVRSCLRYSYWRSICSGRLGREDVVLSRICEGLCGCHAEVERERIAKAVVGTGGATLRASFLSHDLNVFSWRTRTKGGTRVGQVSLLLEVFRTTQNFRAVTWKVNSLGIRSIGTSSAGA